MYPVVFRVGQFEITSFGVLVALAVLVAWWVFSREVRTAGIPDKASEVALYAVIGGFAGAKLLWAVEHSAEESFVDLVFSRGGLSWFGGFIGGEHAVAYIQCNYNVNAFTDLCRCIIRLSWIGQC